MWDDFDPGGWDFSGPEWGGWGDWSPDFDWGSITDMPGGFGWPTGTDLPGTDTGDTGWLSNIPWSKLIGAAGGALGPLAGLLPLFLGGGGPGGFGRPGPSSTNKNWSTIPQMNPLASLLGQQGYDILSRMGPGVGALNDQGMNMLSLMGPGAMQAYGTGLDMMMGPGMEMAQGQSPMQLMQLMSMAQQQGNIGGLQSAQWEALQRAATGAGGANSYAEEMSKPINWERVGPADFSLDPSQSGLLSQMLSGMATDAMENAATGAQARGFSVAGGAAAPAFAQAMPGIMGAVARAAFDATTRNAETRLRAAMANQQAGIGTEEFRRQYMGHALDRLMQVPAMYSAPIANAMQIPGMYDRPIASQMGMMQSLIPMLMAQAPGIAGQMMGPQQNFMTNLITLMRGFPVGQTGTEAGTGQGPGMSLSMLLSQYLPLLLGGMAGGWNMGGQA